MIYTGYIIPLMMIIIGCLMYKYPPKKINWIVGYRTRQSMKNKNSWEKANRYCGELWLKIGLVMLGLVLILHVLCYLEAVIITETILSIFVLTETVPLLLPIFIVEKKIKNMD